MSPGRRLAPGGVALLLYACLGAPPPSSSRRDSSGIEIVESSRPAEAGVLVLDSTSLAFDLGGAASGPHGEYIGPISAAVTLLDGSIAVSGWAQQELRIFDSTGRWLRSIGRPGSGPGEFEGLGFVFRGPADSLITFEPTNRRLQVFSSGGAFHRLTTPTALASRGFPWSEGVFHDGSLLVRGALPDTSTSNASTVRERVTLLRYYRDGDRADSLDSYLGPPNVLDPTHRGWTVGTAMFHPSRSQGVSGDLWATADGERFEIRRRNTRTGRERLIRRDWRAESISKERVRQAAEYWTANLDSARREPVRDQLIATSATTSPAIEAVIVGLDERVWALTGGQAPDGPRRWSVFDPTGVWQAEVTVPAGVRVLEAGLNYLLGTAPDGDGFHHLRRYRLQLAR